MVESMNNYLQVKGLTAEHKQFLREYAQKELGTTSKTKAIIHIIEQLMRIDNHQDKTDLNNAINIRTSKINEYRELISQHKAEIKIAKQNNNSELANKLARQNVRIKRKRIQLSLPIYDYEYLEKISKSTDSSIQYYIIKLIYKDLYNEIKLLGNEIEQLRKSNYELHKIGVNINQIAREINSGNPIGIPIKYLIDYIENHVKMVMNLLNSSLNT